MSTADYKVLRTLLAATNMTIHEFRHFKITMFNLRWYMEWVKKYKNNATKIDQLSTTHANINKIKDKYSFALLRAFFAYTPLIKSQLVVMVFLAIAQFFLKLGIKSLRLESLLSFLSWLKAETLAHSNHSPQRA